MTPRIGIYWSRFSQNPRSFKNTFHFWTSTFGTEIVILWKNSHTPPNCCHCRKVSKGSCTHNTHMCREHSQYFPFLKLVFPYLQLWISISSHNSQFHNMEWFLFCFLSGDIWRLVWVLLSVSAGSICQLKTIQYNTSNTTLGSICQLKAAAKLKSTARRSLTFGHQRWPGGY